MKKLWVVLGLLSLGLISTSVTMNYIATHSGPFAYYRLKHPNLSANEIAKMGNDDVNKFSANSKTGLEAESFMRDLNMQCTTHTTEENPGMAEFYVSEVDLAKMIRCHHDYGLMFGQRSWRIYYFLNSSNVVTSGASLLICPICQGI